mmetsp:Transcript_9502/g.14602  ORF Transcript_9502/g.14602 Transcript_9502/m.14602 type:complete len:102 (+) Transcript_9502:106-411(+)
MRSIRDELSNLHRGIDGSTIITKDDDSSLDSILEGFSVTYCQSHVNCNTSQEGNRRNDRTKLPQERKIDVAYSPTTVMDVLVVSDFRRLDLDSVTLEASSH